MAIPPLHAQLRAVFLDMDHTLCDTARADAKGSQHLVSILVANLGLNESTAGAEVARFMSALYQPEDVLKREPEEEEALFRARLMRTVFMRSLGKDIGQAQSRHWIRELMDARFAAFDYFPQARNVMAWLRERYRTAVITNGPTYSQAPKIKAVDLEPHVDEVFISGQLPWQKPDRAIFDHVCAEIGVLPSQALHVGDSLGSDIAGANGAGLNSVWINPKGDTHPAHIQPHHQIREICELPALIEAFYGTKTAP